MTESVDDSALPAAIVALLGLSSNSETRQHSADQKQHQIAAPMSTSETEVTSLITQPMLRVAPSHCTRIRHCTSMKSPPPSSRAIQREDINGIDNARVFLLHNLMTREECDHYITETEEIVYRDLKNEFDSEYRSNQRVLVASPVLADMLFARLLPYLNRSDVIRIRPMCFGNEGSWRPVRLNEMFKFGKYQKREHFGTHIDGPWVPRTDESSIYTVLLYLNDDFLGGRTVFLPEHEKEEVDVNIQQMRKSEERNVMEEEDMHLHPSLSGSQSSSSLSSSSSSSSPLTLPLHHHTSSSQHTTIFPRCGSALFFTHDTLHAGLPVRHGCKYVLRTELMFQRIDTASLPKSITQDFNTSPEYKRTLMMYLDSYAKEKAGDVTGFTNSYLEALKLQHHAQLSVNASTHAIHQLNLPVVLYIHTFSFLPLPDLISSLKVNHAFKDIARDGSLWKCMYQVRYGSVGGEVESMINAVASRRRKVEEEEKKETRNNAAATSTPSSSPPPSTSSSSSSFPSPSSSAQLTPAVSFEMDWIPESQLQPTNSKSSSSSVSSSFTTLTSRVSVGFGRPIDPSVQDWMTTFRQRYTLEADFSPICFDLGSSITKCAVLKTGAEGMRQVGSEFSSSTTSLPPIIEILTIVARIEAYFHMHIRISQWERNAVGSQALMYNPEHILYPVAQGKIVEMSLIPEMIAAAYLRLGLASYQHPVILAEPPFSWSSSHKRQLARQMFSIFKVPSVCFVNSALLVLLAHRMISGIVVSVGSETVWIASVYQGEMIECMDLSSEFASPNLKFNQSHVDRRTNLNADGDIDSIRRVNPRYGQPTLGKEDAKEKEKLETKHVRSSRLAKTAQQVYHRMIAHISSSSSSSLSTAPNDPSLATLHHVVLTGGTADDSFRQEFREAVRVANLFSSSSSSSATVQDLQIVSSSSPIILNPLHHVIEGARIFSTLSMFRQHCIQAFEIRVNDLSASSSSSSWSSFGNKLKKLFSSSLPRQPSYHTQESLEHSLISHYTHRWHPLEWLKSFHVFWTIKKNFHWEWSRGGDSSMSSTTLDNIAPGDDTHLLLVSNLPSSPEELTRLLQRPQLNSSGYSNYQSMTPEARQIRIIWRRNCMTQEEWVKKAKVWNRLSQIKRKEFALTAGNDISPPLHRPRRSPYAVLPLDVARWYRDFSHLLRLSDDIQQQEKNRRRFNEHCSQSLKATTFLDTWSVMKSDILYRRRLESDAILTALATIRRFNLDYLSMMYEIEEWPGEQARKEMKEESERKLTETAYNADKIEEELELDEEEFVPEK